MGGLRTHLHHSIMIPMQAGGIKETGTGLQSRTALE